MTQKLLNGQLVDLTPEEQAEYDQRNSPAAIVIQRDVKSDDAADQRNSPAAIVIQRDVKSDDAAERVFGTNADPAMKAIGLVMADLALASGVAPDLATARDEVRTRWRNYYRQQLDDSS